MRELQHSLERQGFSMGYECDSCIGYTNDSIEVIVAAPSPIVGTLLRGGGGSASEPFCVVVLAWLLPRGAGCRGGLVAPPCIEGTGHAGGRGRACFSFTALTGRRSW